MNHICSEVTDKTLHQPALPAMMEGSRHTHVMMMVRVVIVIMMVVMMIMLVVMMMMVVVMVVLWTFIALI